MAGFQSGCTASVMIGAVAYAFDTWDEDIKNSLSKVTNFTSVCNEEWIKGVYSGDFTCSGPYANGAMGFTLGDSYTLILKTPDLVLTNTLILKNIKLTCKADDAARISCVFSSSGAFSSGVL